MVKKNRKNWTIYFLILLFSMIFGFTIEQNNNGIPIFFQDYGFEIRGGFVIGDTIKYNKSAKEDFKIFFYDAKGKCYFEKYEYGKLLEAGYFESSLDTLKRYSSIRYGDGKTSKITVSLFFQPLKNGKWLIHSKKRIMRIQYSLGIEEKKLRL